jgi:ubiquinone/menaquinone biosynthesis C-methylase UbiE
MKSKRKLRGKKLASPAAEGVPRSDAIAEPASGTLFEFRHGLGDLIQFSIILRHLAEQQPAQTWDVVCGAGKEYSWTRYERRRFCFQDPCYDRARYSQVVSIDWDDCRSDVDGLPSTKVYECLTSVVRLEPRQELFRYELLVPKDALDRAAQYLESICGRGPGQGGRFPVVLIHHQGNSSRMQKDLPSEVVAEVCNFIRGRGKAVAILPTGSTSPLVDQRTVFCPLLGLPLWQDRANGDPQTVAALLQLAEAHVGIDSGPTHVAGALNTPTVCVWTHHHPIRFYDFSPNVLHLVPHNHQRLAPGPRSLATFQERYRNAIYQNMAPAICEQLEAILGSETIASEPKSTAIAGLTATGYTEDYYVQHLLGGLDYLGHGEWQRTYGTWLADVLNWRGKRVLEVGCACGSVMRGLGEAGIVVEGVDCSEYLIDLGRDKWPDMAELLHVGDAVNLHWCQDSSWDGLHSNQVAEHWKPELVPFILYELRRVLKPGGRFFCVLDTTELFLRHGREMKDEDRTHLCVRPLEWWHDQLRDTGWKIVTPLLDGRLREHTHSFFKRYDWEYFVAEKQLTE